MGSGVRRLPRLTGKRLPLTREVEMLDEHGERRCIRIPNEHPLTLYVGKRELITLMTLGAAPELSAHGSRHRGRIRSSRCVSIG